jgi:hypothetical protein
MKSRLIFPIFLLLALSGCTMESSSDTKSTPSPKEKAPYAYSILKTVKRKVVTNYHIWIKDTAFTKEGLSRFNKFFRKENCSGQCNISLYDTDKIKNDIDNFDLEGKKYVFFADHLIGYSEFEMPDSPIEWYPWQDFQYGKAGGKNWKKKPIK